MIPALRRLKQKDHELGANLGYVARLALDTEIKPIKKGKENVVSDSQNFINK